MQVNYGIRLGIYGYRDPLLLMYEVEEIIKKNKWQSIDYITGNLGSQMNFYLSYDYEPEAEYNALIISDDGSDLVKEQLVYAKKNNIPIIYIGETKTNFIERIVVENYRTYVPRQNDYVIYVGRGICDKAHYIANTGNPFTVAEYGRGFALQKYKEWVTPDKVKHLHQHIKTISSDKRIVLLCWCKPLPCHGDVIKEMLLEMGI